MPEVYAWTAFVGKRSQEVRWPYAVIGSMFRVFYGVKEGGRG